jgi:hypothetical protein
MNPLGGNQLQQLPDGDGSTPTAAAYLSMRVSMKSEKAFFDLTWKPRTAPARFRIAIRMMTDPEIDKV